jgi:DNA-binding transcriptional LysR family regulator
MDLRTLKHVVVLSKQLSYTKAARELCITQSALTRSIQAIEKHANTRLFDRDRSGVRLTTVGRAFVERASGLLREANELEKMLLRSAAAHVGEIAFGMGPLAAQALLPAVLSMAFQSRPELRTRVQVRNVAALLPALLQEEIEFFISPEELVPASAPVNRLFLDWFPLSLLARSTHPVFASTRSAKPGQYPLLSAGQFKQIDRWPRYCQPYLSGPLHIIEDYGVAARVTESTDAVWLCSTFAADTEIRAGQLKEIRPPSGQKTMRIAMMLYSLEKRTLSPGAMLLRDMIQVRIRALRSAAS